MRFGVTIPAISPWHRAVCGDLTSAFDFAGRSDATFPELPDVAGASGVVLAHMQRPKIVPPDRPQPPAQERGLRRSRALPYALHADFVSVGDDIELRLSNAGSAGAVFQLYDRNALDRIPRRYTVEAGKTLQDRWRGTEREDLWLIGPNGYLRTFEGPSRGVGVTPQLRYDPSAQAIELTIDAPAGGEAIVRHLRYRDATETIAAAAGTTTRRWSVRDSHGWYDLSVSAAGRTWRFAGRMETGEDSVSDPALA